MNNLRFNRLLVLSDTQKSANLFEFHKKYNLITARDNSVGKTSIAKSLLWALGASPVLDKQWKALDCKTLLYFSIGQKEYCVYRYQDRIKIREQGKPFEVYSKITGEYAERFSALVSFHALLPKRDGTQLDTPPPIYYLLPFYIDQKRGWSERWRDFDNLGQYDKWHNAIIKYHTGYLSPKYFEFEQLMHEQLMKKEAAKLEMERIDTTLDVVKDYIPQTTFTLDKKKFEKITNEVREKLSSLASEQEVVLDKLANSTSEVYHLRSQMHLIQVAIEGAEKDYLFSIENIKGDSIECPVCGTQHSNTIVDKAGILADKAQLKKQKLELQNILTEQEEVLSSHTKLLSDIRIEINAINEKYAINDNQGERRPLSNVIDSLASQVIHSSVENPRKKQSVAWEGAVTSYKSLKEKRDALLTKEKKQELDEYFISLLTEYIEFLGADTLSLDGIKSPLDHKKVVENGGAADGIRALLAYQATLLNMMHTYSDGIMAPLIVDTPKQQEQSKVNYKYIIDLLLQKVPRDEQIILCAMEDPLLEPYKKKAKVITLDKKRELLQKDKYAVVRQEMREAIEAK